MEIQDGFIVGIFNYCDRWCERCEFTSRCRVFADMAEMEASLDPGLKPIVDAPPLPAEAPPPPPPWMQELIDDMNRAASEPVPTRELRHVRPVLTPEHERISERAHEYFMRVHGWLKSRSRTGAEPPSDPASVVAWFHTLVPAKVHRALMGLADDDPEERDWPADFDGSAKVALLGIEQSHVAWLQLLEARQASGAEAQVMIADLVWLGEELERVFPNARAFVRPAFDEPDAVGRLRALERR